MVEPIDPIIADPMPEGIDPVPLTSTDVPRDDAAEAQVQQVLRS